MFGVAELLVLPSDHTQSISGLSFTINTGAKDSPSVTNSIVRSIVVVVEVVGAELVDVVVGSVLVVVGTMLVVVEVVGAELVDVVVGSVLVVVGTTGVTATKHSSTAFFPSLFVTVSVNVVSATSFPVVISVPLETLPMPWSITPVPFLNTAISVVAPPNSTEFDADVKLVMMGAGLQPSIAAAMNKIQAIKAMRILNSAVTGDSEANQTAGARRRIDSIRGRRSGLTKSFAARLKVIFITVSRHFIIITHSQNRCSCSLIS